MTQDEMDGNESAWTLDLGDDVTLRPIVHHDGSGALVAFIMHHPCKDKCGSFVSVKQDDPGPSWTCSFSGVVESIEQLRTVTLSPSLLCTACGHHGFVRNGKWEACQ